MTPEVEAWRAQWRAYLADRAGAMARTVVDTRSGLDGDGLPWCEVFDAEAGHVLATYSGTVGEITAAFDRDACGRWITVVKIEEALNEMTAEVWPGVA